MNTHVKTYLTIPLLFIAVALLWSIIGNALFKKSSQSKSDEEFTLLNKVTTNIFVNDVNSSINFYSKLIGFEVEKTFPDSGKLDFAILKYGEIEIMIQNIESISSELTGYLPAEFAPNFSFYFETDSLQYLYDKIKKECKIVKDIHNSINGTKEFYIEDPDGYIIGFSQQIKN